MLKAVAKSLVSSKAIGIPAAKLLQLMGQDYYRSRVLESCGFLPQAVRVRLPAHLCANASFVLSSARGTDQIAWVLWTHGWNGFERPMLDVFAAAVRSSQAIVDIGANSGLYAVLAAGANKQARIHAFEPLPQALHVLRENVRLNRADDRITIVEAAASDETGSAQFFIPAGNAGVLEMSASLSREFRAHHSQVICVPVTTLDQYVHERGIIRIDLLKVDVESQEHRVLQGASAVLSKHRPLILLEVLPSADVATLEAIRQKHEYIVFNLRPYGLVGMERLAVDPVCQNQLLAPAEAMPRLKKIADMARLRLLLPARKAAPLQVAAAHQ